MKILALVGADMSRLSIEEMQRREHADETPRASLFESSLNADMMGERFLRQAPVYRRILYNVLPKQIAQIIEAFCLRKNYDAVISWSEHQVILFGAILKFTGSKTPPHLGICYWVSPFKKAWSLRLVQSHVDRLFIMSTSQRDFAIQRIKIPEKKVVPMRWFVDERFWRPLGLDGEMISSSGREYRDYPTLVEALRGTSIRCHIAAKVTPGKNDEWIRVLKKDEGLPINVNLAINETLAEVRQVLARSRFVVVPLLPCDQDVGSTVILEAMAMGKPVIVSSIEGQRDIVREGETGLYVSPQDPLALRNAILTLWNDPERVQEMGKRARAYVEEHHTLGNWIRKIKLTVEEAITSSKQ